MASTLMIAERLLLINSQKEIYKALGLSGGGKKGREGKSRKGEEQSKLRGLADASAIISLFTNKKQKNREKHTEELCWEGAETGRVTPGCFWHLSMCQRGPELLRATARPPARPGGGQGGSRGVPCGRLGLSDLPRSCQGCAGTRRRLQPPHTHTRRCGSGGISRGEGGPCQRLPSPPRACGHRAPLAETRGGVGGSGHSGMGTARVVLWGWWGFCRALRSLLSSPGG